MVDAAEIDPNHAMVEALKAAAKSVTGRDAQVDGAGGCDLRLPVLYGNTPSVLFGPSGAMIHSTDEYIEFEQVIDCARVLARMAVDWCGVAD